MGIDGVFVKRDSSGQAGTALSFPGTFVEKIIFRF